MTDKPHQLARSVKRERPGAPSEFYARFFGSAIAFSVVALIATGHQVFPGRSAAARARHDVVEGQFGSRENAPAKLARVSIA
jgi:hypothetical protein